MYQKAYKNPQRKIWIWASNENSKQGNAVNSFHMETETEKTSITSSVFLLPLFSRNPTEISHLGNWWIDATGASKDDLADINVLCLKRVTANTKHVFETRIRRLRKTSNSTELLKINLCPWPHRNIEDDTIGRANMKSSHYALYPIHTHKVIIRLEY